MKIASFLKISAHLAALRNKKQDKEIDNAIRLASGGEAG